MPTVNMTKVVEMTLTTLMMKTILAQMLRIDKRRLVTMAAKKTWVHESLTEIDLQDLLESTVFEIPYNNARSSYPSGNFRETGKNQNDHADDTMTGDELKVVKEDFIDGHVIDVDHLSTLCESEIINTRKVAAASGHLSLERGYNQRCQWYQNLQTDVPKLHHCKVTSKSMVRSWRKVCSRK